MSTKKNIRAYLNSKDIATTMTGFVNEERWGVESINVGNELYFEANTAGSTVKLTKNGTPSSVILEFSTNYVDWNTYTFGDIIKLTDVGDRVYLRNTSTITTGFSTSSGSFYQFVMTGTIAGGGDINFLLNKNSTTTELSSYCYHNLFSGCTSLTTAPSLPATTLAQWCYGYMFYGCTALTTVPALPATTLATNCYYQMFYGCTGLTTPPALPATNLATGCYFSMFRGCTNLIAVPALPATTLASACYQGMFTYCSKIKLSETQTGDYQTAYRIPTAGTGTTASNAMDIMFYGTGGTFKGAPTINTTYYTSNTIVS